MALGGQLLGILCVLNRGNIQSFFPILGAWLLSSVAGSCLVVKRSQVSRVHHDPGNEIGFRRFPFFQKVRWDEMSNPEKEVMRGAFCEKHTGASCWREGVHRHPVQQKVRDHQGVDRRVGCPVWSSGAEWTGRATALFEETCKTKAYKLAKKC